MDVERFRRIRELFDAAVDREPGDRHAYLQEACGGDEELIAELEQLIAADASSAGGRSHAKPISSLLGQRIGNYEILSQLGEGGMGIVYLAEQREPLQRRVALKLMKPGLDTNRVLARFESERQALAMMSHPGVARVFDAGVAEDGRPYFVMEYVEGTSITEFCDRRQLPVPERLKLFVQVCDAIHHAHQKGLLHRDIKPSNVMVSDQDTTAAVKVIDFGVAKAIDQPASERTLLTEHGMLVGTPAYMSPEQAGTTALDVDTRSDIYSLGVLLYELLVGALPHDPQILRQAAAAEMLRMIREDDPPKPTTRIEKLGSTAEAVARQRQTDVRSLIRFLKGDLDWITMRALEKDPVRRYASASEFGADIGRYLSEEPVVAGPPTAAYRIRKLAWKHRRAVAAVCAVFLALTLGVIASTLLYFRADDERQRVQIEADALQAALRDQPELYTRLAAEAIRRHRLALGADNLPFARFLANHVVFLSLFPYNPPERQEWRREALRIVERDLDRGDVAAVDVFLVLADPFDDTGEQESITRLAAKSLDLLGKQTDKSNRASLELLADLSERGLPAADPDADAERVARQVLALRSEDPAAAQKLSQTRENLADILARKASALRRRGDPAGAVPVFREALALLKDVGGNARGYTSARLLELQSELGVCLSETGKLDEAEPLLTDAYRELLKTEGRKSSATQSVMRRLIDLYEKNGLPEKAAAYRKDRGSIALADAWDMGPVKLPSADSGWDERVSTTLNDRSAWLLWKDSGAIGAGWLDEASLASGQPRILEMQGQNVPLESPRSTVADPVSRRTLVFHSRSERTVLSVWPDGSQGSLTFAPEDPNWGAASLAVGNYLYTYGCRKIEGSLEMECVLGRVPLAQALDRTAWSYYAGSGSWSPNLQAAQPAIRLDQNARFSVHWNAHLKKYMAICTRSLDHRIRIRLADRPEGPWSSEPDLEIEGLASAVGLRFTWIRSSTGHPELARENGRFEYLSYARATASGYQIRLVRLEFD